MDTVDKIVSENRLKEYLKSQLATQEHQLENLAKEDVYFVSSKKFLGFKRLVKSLQIESKFRKTRGMKRNIFVIGNINSGKSTFIQSLHNNMKRYNKKFIHDPFDKIIKKGIQKVKESETLTTEQKLILTSSLVPQTTLDIRKVQIPKLGLNVFDTPGFINHLQPYQLINSFPMLKLASFKNVTKMRRIRLKFNESIWLGGLFRLDLLSDVQLDLLIYVPDTFSVHKMTSEKANQFYLNNFLTKLSPVYDPEIKVE
jgi:ribosome biogenesis GTPase A